MKVILSEQEVQFGCIVGAKRHMESIANDRRDQHGFDPDEDSGFLNHIRGAIGELAVAKHLGRYYSGPVGNFKAADIGARLQVRARRHEWHDLIVRKDDDPQHAYVLVTGDPPELIVRGWLWGHEAKQEQHLCQPNRRPPAYFVKQEYLKPLGAKNGQKV